VATAAVQPQPAAVQTADEVVGNLARRITTAQPTVVFTSDSDPSHLLGQGETYAEV
jgi:hypothetical protein